MAGKFGWEALVNRRARLSVGILAVFGIFLSCPGPDLTPPRVSIGYPAEGAVVSGAVAVVLYAVDDRGVQRVEFLVDDSLAGTAAHVRDSVFSFLWDLSGYPAGGVHRIFCRAFDRAGNCDSSGVREVTTYPLAGTHHQGGVSADETWDAAGNPHYVYGDFRVKAVLTLGPGVVVKLMPNARLRVEHQGALRAAGAPDAYIRFTGVEGGEPFYGLGFFNCADTAGCVLRFCVLENGGAGGALLEVQGTRVRVENCSLQNSAGDGVRVQAGGFSSFRENLVQGCAGFPLVTDAPGAGTLGANNRFQNNGRNLIHICGGEITNSCNWANQGVPYLVTGSVTVAGDASPSLTIAPGCTLLFADSCRLRIGVGKPGALIADGGTSTIVFQAAEGYWGGLEFWNSTLAQTLLKNCVVDRAGKNGIAAILVAAPVELNGTRVLNSAVAGIYCINCGFARFEYNRVAGCAGCPLRLPASNVGTLGPGNQLGGNQLDFIDVYADTITRDAAWLNHGVPYHISGLLEVGSIFNPNLTIAPGVTLRFSNNSGIRVGEFAPGRLVAIGTPDSIVFTGDSARPGAWRGIDFGIAGGSGSVLERCRIVYGSGGGALGIVTVRNCSPTIVGNEIAYSARYCIALFNTPLDPEQLRRQNYLHDWGEEYDDIYEGGN